MPSSDENSFFGLNWFYCFCVIIVSLRILIYSLVFIDQHVLTYFRRHNFKSYGKWAVITGCTDGIGKGYAIALAKKGLDICLISRSDGKLKAVAKEIEQKYGVKTKCVVADFSDPEIYGHIKDNLIELEVGILVNNVGIAEDELSLFISQSEQAVKSIINTNITSAIMMTHLVLSQMMDAKRGLIINISSLVSKMPCPYATLYSSTKAFLTVFGDCLAFEMRQYNVKVKTFSAGFVKTKLTDRHADFVNVLTNIIPSSMLTVEEFVNNSLRMVSSKSSDLNGAIMYDVSWIATILLSWKYVSRELVYLFLKTPVRSTKT